MNTSKHPLRVAFLVVSALALVMALVACAQATVTPTPDPTSTPVPTSTPDTTKTYQWNGTIVVSQVEGRHLELDRGCDTWVLQGQSSEVTSKLEANAGSKVLIWGKVYTGNSIYMKQTIAVDAAFGPGDPVPMTLVAVPIYLCPNEIPSGTPSASTGHGVLYGQVNIGPLCPVEPCQNPQPDIYSSRSLLITDVTNKPYTVTIKVPLDQDGNFKDTLKAGTYEVNLTDCTYMGCSRVLPQTVEVKAGESVSLAISIDTGIR